MPECTIGSGSIQWMQSSIRAHQRNCRYSHVVWVSPNEATRSEDGYAGGTLKLDGMPFTAQRGHWQEALDLAYTNSPLCEEELPF